MARSIVVWGLVAVLVSLAGAAAETSSPRTERGELEELSRRVRPSVVEILGTVDPSGDTSYGTGFVVEDRNLVVTNAHVVRGVENVMVRTLEGAVLASVEVLFQDASVDVAVLRVVGLDLEPLPLAEGPAPEIGTPVVAVGHPRGYEFTVSNGIVSALRSLERDGPVLIQTTAPISPGSSGGPLLDVRGRVLGVCSLTLMEGQNINFAVPVREVAPVIAQAREVEHGLTADAHEALGDAALAELVRRHREDGDLARAGKLVRRALKRHPRSLPLLVEAAEVAWSRGSLEEVEAIVKRADTLRPGYGPALQIDAALHAERGECEDAVRDARASIEAGLGATQEAEAHATLGDCLARLGRSVEALDHVDEALRDERIAALPDYHVLRAFLLQALGRLDAADQSAVDALRLAAWDPLVVAALRERELPRLIEVLSFTRETGAGDAALAIVGIVRNAGPVPLREIVVTAEGLDEEGSVVATGTATVDPSRLVPGQTGSFRAPVRGLTDRAVAFAVRVVDYVEPR